MLLRSIVEVREVAEGRLVLVRVFFAVVPREANTPRDQQQQCRRALAKATQRQPLPRDPSSFHQAATLSRSDALAALSRRRQLESRVRQPRTSQQHRT